MNAHCVTARAKEDFEVVQNYVMAKNNCPKMAILLSAKT